MKIVTLVFCAVLIVPMSVKAASVPSGDLDMSVVLTLTGKPDGTPVKDLFQRDPDDTSCSKCKSMTLGAAAAGVLRMWSDLDNQEFKSPTGGLDEAAVVGQKRAREKLAEKIEANPSAVGLSGAEQTRLVKLLSRILVGPTFAQAVAVINPNAEIPEMK